MNKEEIYDDQISPLMKEIVAICQANGIAMIASYAIPNDEDENLRCTTHLGDENGDSVPDFRRACVTVQGGDNHFAAFTITKP